MFKPCLIIITSTLFFLNIAAFASEDYVSRANCSVEISTRYGEEIIKKENFSISRDGSDHSKKVILEIENKKFGSLFFWIEVESLNIVKHNTDRKMLSMNMARGKSFTTLDFIEGFAVSTRCKMEN